MSTEGAKLSLVMMRLEKRVTEDIMPPASTLQLCNSDRTLVRVAFPFVKMIDKNCKDSGGLRYISVSLTRILNLFIVFTEYRSE